MADGKKDIAIRAGIDPGGAEDIAKAADKALSPWQQGAAKVGGAMRSAFQGAVTDMGRAVLVGNAINFSQALDSARKYREEIGRLSAVSGPVGALRAQVREIGTMRLLRDSEIVAADRGLGRMTYNAKGALAALGGLQDAALATGESLEQKLPLGAVLMSGLGVAGKDVASELDRVRGLTDALGTSGGLLAAEDRLKSLSGLLGEIGVKADRDRATFEAMALGLGKGLSPKAGERVAGNIMGALSNNRETFAVLSGQKIGALTDEQGNLRMDNAMKAAERVQGWVRRQSKDRGMQQMIAASLFGGDRQSGGAFLNANFAEIGAAARANPHSDKTRQEAEAFRKSDAGQAIGRQMQMERTARETAERALPAADAAQSVLAKNPILGGVLAGAGLNLAGQGIAGGIGKIGGMFAGGSAIEIGGAEAASRLVGGADSAARSIGEAAGKEAKSAEKLVEAANNILGKYGMMTLAGSELAGLAVGLGAVAAGAAAAAKVLHELGEAGGEKKHGYGNVTLTQAEADERAKAAKAAAEKGAAIRSGEPVPTDESKFHRQKLIWAAVKAYESRDEGEEGYEGVLRRRSPESLREIRSDPSLKADIADAISKIKIVVENHSENPIAVNNQQVAGSMGN